MKLDLLARLNGERAARRACVVLTDIATGVQDLVLEDDLQTHPMADVARRRLRLAKSGIETVDGREMFCAVTIPPTKLIVIGAVHISQAMLSMADPLGLDLTIIDPRTAFATAARFPEANLMVEWPVDALPTLKLDRYTALAALTHDPKIDDDALAAALEADCFYVGALGSRKTHSKRLERLAARGFLPEQIARIRAPIGLDIGAATPAEIALSILAEIVAAHRLAAEGAS